jgi:DNA-binding CsgD family transcriptional regulator
MQGMLDAVEALVVTSHPDQRRFLGLLDGINSERADLVAAHRWRDCCVAALNGLPDGIEELDTLHIHWLSVDNTLWAARALVLSARVMRRSGHRRESADRFGRAHELFVRIGANAWAETVLGEADRDGRPRVHGGSALTGNERRVAELAAGGATNRNIAQAMFISEKTVEATLTAVYRKLGVVRRSQLHLALSVPRA